MRATFILLCLTTIAMAEQARPSLQERMYQVCQEQRNAAMTWHAGAEAQRMQLVDEIVALRLEINKLKTKVGGPTDAK